MSAVLEESVDAEAPPRTTVAAALVLDGAVMGYKSKGLARWMSRRVEEPKGPLQADVERVQEESIARTKVERGVRKCPAVNAKDGV